MVAGVAAWNIWGNDIFPSQDPTGGMYTIYFFCMRRGIRCKEARRERVDDGLSGLSGLSVGDSD
jgi:hypothetical protein